MGILEALTLLFIALKLTGAIDWNWFFVLLPEIIAIGIYIFWFTVAGLIMGSWNKKIK